MEAPVRWRANPARAPWVQDLVKEVSDRFYSERPQHADATDMSEIPDYLPRSALVASHLHEFMTVADEIFTQCVAMDFTESDIGAAFLREESVVSALTWLEKIMGSHSGTTADTLKTGWTMSVIDRLCS